MNRTLKKIALVPFRLLDTIKLNGESVLWRCAFLTFSDDAKLRMSRQALFGLMARKSPDIRFKIAVYLNALGQESVIAERFAANLIDNISLFESQLGQDCLVDTIFGGKTDGLFVEVGVGDGKNISNTYFLERSRNWTGILCEPSIKFKDSILQQRTSRLVTEAVYDRSGLELEFSEVIGSEELSTLTDETPADSHDRSRANTYVVRSISFNDLYKEYIDGKTIDYFSLDTEGSELTILKAIDLDRIKISVISVEHNYDHDKLAEIKRILEPSGYVELLPGVFEFDSIFVKREIVERLGTSATE